MHVGILANPHQNKMAAVEDLREFPNQAAGAVWQDSKGEAHGRSVGVITIYEKCNVLTDEMDIPFEDYRDDMVQVMEEEMLDFDETRSASVLKPSGFVTMQKLTTLQIFFVQKFGNEWPVAVEWEGPKATLEFWSEGGYVMRSQELRRSGHLAKTKLVGCPKEIPFKQIRLQFHGQHAVRCRIQFQYKTLTPRLKNKGLANDMFMDEASKDLTLVLDNGREELKVHQVIMRMYSPVYKQRFEGWTALPLNLASDSKQAWTLILDCLYDRAIVALDSPFLAEAMQIAMRDNFFKFSNMAWAFALRSVQRETVLPLLRMAWEYRGDEELKDIAKCMDKCFEFIFQNLASLGASWMMNYSACLYEFPEMQEYADAYSKNHHKRRRL